MGFLDMLQHPIAFEEILAAGSLVLTGFVRAVINVILLQLMSFQLVFAVAFVV